MIIRSILLLAFLTLLSVPSLAQTSLPIVHGAAYLNASRITSLKNAGPSDSLEHRLRRVYSADGFFDVRFRRSGDTLIVEEGRRYHFGDVRLRPDSVGRKLLTGEKRASELVGAPFSEEALDRTLARIVGDLNVKGYALASARFSIPRIDTDSATVDILISVDTGDVITINQIRVVGAQNTSERLIVRTMNIPDDAVFTDELARNVRERLVRLKAFSRVEEPQIYVADSGGYGLLVTVEEGGTNTFDGVIGYQPAVELEENGYFTGLVHIVLRNLFGAGERIAGRWEKRTRTTSELELGYGQPFIFGTPIDIDILFRQIQEEETAALTSYVQRYLSGDLYYSITDDWSVRLGSSLESTIPGPDTTSQDPCSPRRLTNSSTLGVTVGVQFDTRSDPVNPRSGVLYGTSYTFGSKTIKDPDECLEGTVPLSDTRRTVRADVESYVPITGPFVLAGIANFSEISGDNLEESELWRFGGLKTVRGYREGLIRASTVAWGRLEGRVLLSEISHASLFFDGGYYFRNADVRRGLLEAEDGIYGYGVGLQIDTPVGVALFSFALGRGDTFEEGKVSVGLLGEF